MRDSAAPLTALCAGRGYGFPSPPALSRSMKHASERIAAVHDHHPGRRTSQRLASADRPPECCCRPQPAKKNRNPRCAATPLCGRAQALCRWLPDRTAAARSRREWKALLRLRRTCSKENHSMRRQFSREGYLIFRQGHILPKIS